MLLGERGQGKTRLIRTLVGLLDEWTPVIAGCEINDHPYAPVCSRCIALVDQELGDRTPVSWRHRSERYGEKLATPDTSVGDLIGDIDPIKVAEGRTLGDPETVHYGLVPRTNRGIFAVNELPDLAERIQVALLNVLEERDIQVRGYQLRLPLDLLLVASANPEDYTNRGRIITPLKDRFGAEVRTHYPLSLDDELCARGAGGGRALGRLAARRAAGAVAPARRCRPLRPGGSRRAAGRSAFRRLRPLRHRGGRDRCRLGGAARGDHRRGGRRRPRMLTCRPSSRRRSARSSSTTPTRAANSRCSNTCCAERSPRPTRARLAGLDLRPLQEKFDGGLLVEIRRHRVGRSVARARSVRYPGLSDLLERLEPDGVGEGPAVVGVAAAVVEFALEGLYLNKRLAKESSGHRTVYGA